MVTLIDLRTMYNPGDTFKLAKRCKTAKNTFPQGMEFVVLDVLEAVIYAVNEDDQNLTLHRFSVEEYIKGST